MNRAGGHRGRAGRPGIAGSGPCARAASTRRARSPGSEPIRRRSSGQLGRASVWEPALNSAATWKIRHGAIPPIPLQDWSTRWAQRDKPYKDLANAPLSEADWDVLAKLAEQIAWSGVRKPRHFRGVRLWLSTISCSSASPSASRSRSRGRSRCASPRTPSWWPSAAAFPPGWRPRLAAQPPGRPASPPQLPHAPRAAGPGVNSDLAPAPRGRADHAASQPAPAAYEPSSHRPRPAVHDTVVLPQGPGCCTSHQTTPASRSGEAKRERGEPQPGGRAAPSTRRL